MNHQFGNTESVDFKALLLPVVGLCVLGVFSSNPLESLFAILQLFILLRTLWKKNTLPVALLLFLFPWIEISTSVLEANLSGISLNEMLHGTGRMSYWLSAIGLYFVLFGFLIFGRRVPTLDLEEIKHQVAGYSIEKLILAYFAIGPATNVVKSFIPYGSSLYQFTSYLGAISTFILVFIVVRQAVLNNAPRIYILFLMMVTFLSFYSLFSSWKVVAFAIFIGYGTLNTLTRKAAVRIVFLSLLFGNLIFLWQGIKQEYRFFLTNTEQEGRLETQAIRVSQTEALVKFFHLAQDFYSKDESEEESTDLLFRTLRRAGYLEFFAMTLNNVPQNISHENGGLLKKNLSFALIPRFLNPNKGIKDDSAKLTKYTGFMVGENASFSLGHYTEYFIDFGQFGMMIALLGFGLVGGRLFLFVSERGSRHIPMFATSILAYVVLSKWGTFQGDAIYVYGRTFFGAICHCFVFVPIYKFILSFCSLQKT